MNPDCAYGKHAACTGDAWNEIADELTVCDCDCHLDRPDSPQNRPENATGGEKATRGGSDGEGGLKSAHSASVGDRLDEIRAREQAATEGPWRVWHDLRTSKSRRDVAVETAWCHGGIEDVPRLLAAVDAVLELHRPITAYPGGVESTVCEACHHPSQFGVAGKWPCPTVRAITEAVGE